MQLVGHAPEVVESTVVEPLPAAARLQPQLFILPLTVTEGILSPNRLCTSTNYENRILQCQNSTPNRAYTTGHCHTREITKISTSSRLGKRIQESRNCPRYPRLYVDILFGVKIWQSRVTLLHGNLSPQ